MDEFSCRPLCFTHLHIPFNNFSYVPQKKKQYVFLSFQCKFFYQACHHTILSFISREEPHCSKWTKKPWASCLGDSFQASLSTFFFFFPSFWCPFNSDPNFFFLFLFSCFFFRFLINKKKSYEVSDNFSCCSEFHIFWVNLQPSTTPL